MTQREVITEAMLQAAIAALDKRIAMPPLLAKKRYSRREAFAKLRGKAKKHSLPDTLLKRCWMISRVLASA